MVQVAITKITNRFIDAKISNTEKAVATYQKILNILKVKDEKGFERLSLSELGLKSHFKDIDTIRIHLKQTTNLTDHEIENKINYLMSLYLPSQTELNKILEKKDNPYEFLKDLSLLSYYVKKDKNDKNLLWNHESKYGKIKISINKAKPEKTLKEIAEAKRQSSNNNGDEPKCPICVENIGYKGSATKDSRENLRVKFITFSNNEKWFFQYSPYAYLNNHFVLNNIVHQPMKISHLSTANILEFVSKNDNFFLGSNADLPIVGGSLLSHDHYQGGEDTLPIMHAKTIEKFKLLNATINVLNWPLNTIKIVSKNRKTVELIGNYFINNWKHYQNETIVNENNHSTTIIANKKSGRYNLYLIFRNNSVSPQRPSGNFHFHHDKFNIKQENIGLMEAAGLAILPQRLERELIAVGEYVKQNNEHLILNDVNLKKHYEWIKTLKLENKKVNEKNIFKFASEVFLKGLEDCRVLNHETFLNFVKNLIFNLDINVKNEVGLQIKIGRLGATIKDLKLNNRSFVLKYENPISYFNNSIFLNSFVAPIAGRVENNILTKDNKSLILPLDTQKNYIHSGECNLADVLFDLESIDKKDNYQEVILSKKLYNFELKDYYFFKVKIKVFNNENKVALGYQIDALNKPFYANPTQHFYFRLPDTKNIENCLLNINKEDKYCPLSETNIPISIKALTLKKEFNTIADIAKDLGDIQNQIINGYLDHPFISNKNSIILKNKSYEISLSSKIKNFVIYTHNFPSDEKILNFKRNKKNLGICIEFQKIPVSKALNNVGDITYFNTFENEIILELKKIK